jgi:predicted porin
MLLKLIALAIAGLSGAAFAQSTVTISGLLDSGFRQSSTEAATGVKTTTSQWGSSSNTATSNITFNATEDLGNGMKAGMQVNTEPVVGTANAASAFGNSQNYVFLSGKFGEVKAGYFNNLGLEAAVATQPFGTAYGGGYSAGFGRLMGVGDTATAANTLAATGSAGTRLVRTNNSAQYKSPSFSGFQLGVMLHNKNNDVGVAAADATGQTQIGVSYANGPINVNYVNAQFRSGSATSVLGSGGDGKHNILGGNYTFGPATVYAGWTNSTTNIGGTKVVDNASWNLAVKYTMGAWAFLANYLQDNDKLAGNADRKLTGLGVDYALSKRTAAYGRYETYDNNTNATGGKNTNTSVGLRHSF